MLKNLTTALKALNECKKEDHIQFYQDSVVSRFKILADYTWKTVKLYLESQNIEIEFANPKEVYKVAQEANLINKKEYETLERSIYLRNMASHIYDQPKYLLAVEAAPETINVIKTLIQKFKYKA